MFYKSPNNDTGEYWVPIVVKNKDYLIGYLHGFELIKDIIGGTLKSMKMQVNLGSMNLCLDSSRFNDIMNNDKHETSMSKDELKSFYEEVVQNELIKEKEQHPDNYKNGSTSVLDIDCPCGLGFYSWDHVQDVPDESFHCKICGRKLIDYTEHYDYEYEYHNGKGDQK